MHNNLPPLALLAGGLATRLRALTETVPKSLLLVAEEPFLAHQLRLLVRQGIYEIVLCCGHLGEQIEAFAGDGSRFGCSIRYSYDGSTLLGTGGALRHALPLLGESFFVMYGDSYLMADPTLAWKAFLASGKPSLMTVLRNDGKWDASNVEMSGGEIVRYGKQLLTSRMKHIDYGLSILQSSTIEPRRDGEVFDLATVFEELAAKGQLAAHNVHGRFYEVGSPEGLQAIERVLKGLQASERSELLATVESVF